MILTKIIDFFAFYTIKTLRLYYILEFNYYFCDDILKIQVIYIGKN